jgi:hypothetical protein
MHANANVSPDLIMSRLRVFLARKGLDMTVTLLVGVVNYPRLTLLTLRRLPESLADRHRQVPRIV